ncbi:S-methyl-5'-thioadenosine phosphorylase [Actinoplanes sp. URMC 104]|uniref:S-methyl-5'-thioadenosine phosphorylase n=1 Tax=Actinoplanes sp. URMC 104 TaxID=3423409 RepID=UPI003F19C3E0
MTDAIAEIGVFGGSGLYSLFDDEAREYRVDTPYGEPSDVITIGTVGGRRVAFLPRHGRDHRHPPHRIPYRANVWALHHLGVRQILAPCAAGSLDADVCPGDMVVCDQLVDWTRGRAGTFYDGPQTRHIGFAEPYDPWIRATLLAASDRLGLGLRETGTMAVVEGPRFSTAAESLILARLGCSVINMTGSPEAQLARELAVGYATVAIITDHDAGRAADLQIPAVTQEAVGRMFAANLDRLRALLFDTIAHLSSEPSPLSSRALDEATFG